MTWDDLTFRQYLDLTYYYENIDQYEDELDKIVGLMVVFDNSLNIDDLYKKKYIEVQQMFEPVSRLLQTEMVKKQPHHRPFEDFTYGEWINMEHYLKEKDWGMIFATLMKQENPLDLDNIKAVLYLPLYERWLEYRTKIYENYKEVFKMTGEDDIDPDETPEEKAERELAYEDAEKNAQFTWYLHTYDLANGDLTKFDQLFEMNHLFLFNIMDMKKRFKLNEVYRGMPF